MSPSAPRRMGPRKYTYPRFAYVGNCSGVPLAAFLDTITELLSNPLIFFTYDKEAARMLADSSITTLFDLSNQVAIVTGSGRGLGAAIARAVTVTCSPAETSTTGAARPARAGCPLRVGPSS